MDYQHILYEAKDKIATITLNRPDRMNAWTPIMERDVRLPNSPVRWRFQVAQSRDAIDAQRLILLNMDPPEHTRVRQIVQRGFTPRAIRALEDNLRRRALAIAAEGLERLAKRTMPSSETVARSSLVVRSLQFPWRPTII
jgi:enoyl-CoA hydratase/carnithine racemase